MWGTGHMRPGDPGTTELFKIPFSPFSLHEMTQLWRQRAVLVPTHISHCVSRTKGRKQ